MDTKISHDCEERFCSAACQGYHHVVKVYHDCGRCSAACKGYTEKEVEVISPATPPPIIKADAAAPTVTKVDFDFFNDCGVADLSQKINLDLTGIPKLSKKSRKEPKITDTNNNRKEAIKTAPNSKSYL